MSNSVLIGVCEEIRLNTVVQMSLKYCCMYANSVDPDQPPHSAASDLGLHCMQRSICPNTSGYYSKQGIVQQASTKKQKPRLSVKTFNAIFGYSQDIKPISPKLQYWTGAISDWQENNVSY